MTPEPVTPAAAHSSYLRQGYFPALDGLRAVAICGVLWHHSLPGPREGWLGRGFVGVPLFFALSGFLITTRLLAERRQTGEISLGRFWLRRSLRIFPLYYAVLAGFGLYLAWRPADLGSQHFFENFGFYATYTSNWFVDYAVPYPVWFGFAWSLATEEQFYAWWPPLLRRCQRSAHAVLALLGVLALGQLSLYGPLAAELTQHATLFRVLTSVAPALSLGALLALCLDEQRSFTPVWALMRRAPALTAVLPLLGIGVLLVHPFGSPLLLDLAFTAWVASAVLCPDGALGRVLGARPLLAIGRVSYGIYLLHVPVLGLLRRAAPGLVERPEWLFPVALCVSWALASLSYRYFESPLLALKERLRPVVVPGFQ
jgi:peptidoglycan/LPS O-acetylase OafA/YrhL